MRIISLYKQHYMKVDNCWVVWLQRSSKFLNFAILQLLTLIKCLNTKEKALIGALSEYCQNGVHLYVEIVKLYWLVWLLCTMA